MEGCPTECYVTHIRQSPSCKIDIGHLEGTKNWTTWKFKATLLVRGMPALDAVNGNLEKPVKPTTNNAEEISEYQKALDKYNHIDSSALLLPTENIMSDETIQKIIRFNSSKDVWDELHRLFDCTSEDKSYALCTQNTEQTRNRQCAQK
ncbi:hypothetical protein evm_000845 [Chilo suppressalis]|nr:hypothetical protein evm_000845 [Chilo suppressalis]